MSNTVLLKRCGTGSTIPDTNDLAYGELGINYADGLLFLRKSDDSILTVGMEFGDLAGYDAINDNIWSGADLEVVNGGTGASTTGAARTNLGVYSTTEVNSLIDDYLPLAGGTLSDDLSVTGNIHATQLITQDDGFFWSCKKTEEELSGSWLPIAWDENHMEVDSVYEWDDREPTRVRVKDSGRYMITADVTTLCHHSVGPAASIADISVNGNSAYGTEMYMYNGIESQAASTGSATKIVILSTNDYIEVRAQMMYGNYVIVKPKGCRIMVRRI